MQSQLDWKHNGILKSEKDSIKRGNHNGSALPTHSLIRVRRSIDRSKTDTKLVIPSK